ncbi:MAG: L-serine ammonia-lyase [Hydrogenophaga sp.]|jgi:L-serine dehydratase
MTISTFDLFKIGIGPSSSHTVGPMKASALFVGALLAHPLAAQVSRVRCDLYGSLGATGKGHGSHKAVMLGLQGDMPDQVDVATIAPSLARIRESKRIELGGRHGVAFDEAQDLVFHRRETLPFHSNAMKLQAFDAQDALLLSKTYYSVGGGFVVDHDTQGQPQLVQDPTPVAYPFKSGDELLMKCREHGLSVAQLMWANEQAWRSPEEIRSGLLRIWSVMQACIQRGIETDGVLEGGMKVRRRAPELYRSLSQSPEAGLRDQLTIMDWVNLYAMAVNEENAAGGQVVTAPTNGAAGIVPAVLQYYSRFCPGANDQGVIDFLLTAAAIGILYKENASISGAEVGCQGEVGVACSMAAGALAAVMGGTVEQVENAAEIGMEHNLGLTCDPVGGLVQIPCIERNAMGSIKAINAARMALRGDGKHHVSLDKVIKTMRETGADMKIKYKETSRGGLAVNVVEC